jgi:hypothetical protein
LGYQIKLVMICLKDVLKEIRFSNQDIQKY